MSFTNESHKSLRHDDLHNPPTSDIRESAEEEIRYEAAVGNRPVAADRLARKLSARQVQVRILKVPHFPFFIVS